MYIILFSLIFVPKILKHVIMTTEEAKKKNELCVYRLTFPDGKSYIGKTKKLSKRISLYERNIDEQDNSKVMEAVRKFGLDNLTWEIIANPKNIKEDDKELILSILEIKYIREFDTVYPKGYNVSIGGEMLSIPVDCLPTNDIGAKAILVYDENGNFIKDYPSIGRCAYDLGIDDDEVRNNLGKKMAFRGKYIFREKKYNYIPQKIDATGFVVKERVKIREVVQKKYVEKEINVGRPNEAIVYDENGDFVGVYKSKIEALRHFTKSSSVPWGKYHKGYIVYKKPEGHYPMKIEPYIETLNKSLGEYYKPLTQCQYLPQKECKNKNYKTKSYRNTKYSGMKIKCVTPKGERLYFDSISEASEHTGVPYSNIWHSCFKGTVLRNGYSFEVVNW